MNKQPFAGKYTVISEFRQRWAYAIVCRGRTYARCDSFKDAITVAKAMNNFGAIKS